MDWSSLLLAVTVVCVTARVLQFRADLKIVKNLPGLRTAFAPFGLPGALIPTSYFNPGLNWTWLWRKTVYREYGRQTISCVPMLIGPPTIYTISEDVARQVLSTSNGYFKSPESTAALMLWGDNVISSNYDAYKKHRRIVGPAFSGATYAMVAQETVKLYNEMLDAEGWSGQRVVSLDTVNPYISKMALGVVTRCGFGVPFLWTNADDASDEMTFGKALAIVSSGSIARLATPSWAYKLPIKQLHELDAAYAHLSKAMSTLVQSKKEQLAENLGADEKTMKTDLFSRLIVASEAEGGGLDEKELIGNVFTFMFAGHETTGETLAATLALLALYPDEQEKAYAQVKEVLGDGRDPRFDDYAQLDRVLACFQETARMFPAGFLVTRDTTDNVVIKLQEETGEELLALPPGIRIIIDLIGMHYNPAIFPNPEHFDPSRWIGVAESELSFFGFGPRACLGRKFAMTEAVTFLSLVLRDWVIEPILRSGESPAQWRERNMQGKMLGLTWGIPDVPLRLRRRL